MKQIKIIITFALLLSLSSCGLYKNYATPDEIDAADIYGDIAPSVDSTNLALLPWQSLFTDVQLQQLIAYGLQNNTDMRIAKLRIEQAEASLKAAKLAFLPSLALSPQGGAGQFGGGSIDYTYTLPATASWQIDLFGRLRNAKERSKVMVESSKAYQKGVTVELIATIATQYYTLAMLREQAVITEQSAALWAETLRTMQLLMEAGQYNDAGVSQAEASYNRVKAAEAGIKQQIREMENSLSVLLGDKVHVVETNNIASWSKPEVVEVGIPLQLLAMRPDVIQAELALATAFYTTNEARAEFYPNLVLGGSAGWSNVAGVITNPGKFLWDALASFTQPIFQNGRLRAQFKIAQSQQEEAKLQFQQTLLHAGAEVNNAYTQLQTYSQQSVFINSQVNSLERTVKSTQLLMEAGSSNYLEVLTAQDNLLSAQLALVTNQFNEINSYITLYQALGGGIH